MADQHADAPDTTKTGQALLPSCRAGTGQSAPTISARVVSLIGLPCQVRVPALLSRLRCRARSFFDVGDACLHGHRLGDAIAGQEKARSDHCGDEGAAPPDGVG
jgi:hypothetical protein